ncbi:nucleoid-associated protein YejK [Halomonas sp. H5]|uniref:nucleoid-associated protein YejK n=1 Tax=Halomonas sp. H5 TaxID=3423910 RepID=UPI003D36A778
MPILHSIIHRIDLAGEQPARLVAAEAEAAPSPALDELLAGVNSAYHGKTKAWGHFAAASRTATALGAYLDGETDFVSVSRELAQRLTEMLGEHLSVGGHLLLAHYRHGDAEYLSLALLHHREGWGIDADGAIVAANQLNLAQLSLAARLDIRQWRAETPSKQYLSWLRDRGGKKFAEAFAELLGAEEGIDAGGETRTLLKAFSDYVEQEDLADDQAREKTEALLDYASDQARRGESITLEALSEVVDDHDSKAFYEHIRHLDYGLSPEIPPDKKALNQFRRFTGRAGGVSISFDSHLLGSSVEYDETSDRLIIKQVPKQLKEQLKGR